MNAILEWFGFDLGHFNEVSINLATKDRLFALTLILVLIPPSLWFFWTSLRRIQSPSRKVFLISLRMLSFFLLVFIFFKPDLEFKQSHVLKNSIAVLIDDTKSMSIKTFPLEVPRIDFVHQALKNNRDVFESLAKNFQVDYFFASDQIEPILLAELESRYYPQKSITESF